MRTVAQKMGIRENSRAILINAPSDLLQEIGAPSLHILQSLSGQFDYIHLFVKTQKEQEEIFEKLKEHLTPDGMLWISWPKNKQLNTDLNLSKVIKTGYSFGLVESTCLSINPTWSGLKFTHPKKGKEYHNSHAILSSRTTER